MQSTGPVMGAAEGSIENTLAAYPARVRQYVADTADSVTRSAPVFSVVTEPRHD